MRYCMFDKVKIITKLHSLKGSRKQIWACRNTILQIWISNFSWQMEEILHFSQFLAFFLLICTILCCGKSKIWHFLLSRKHKRKKCKITPGKFCSRYSIIHGINSYSTWSKDSKGSQKTMYERNFRVLPKWSLETSYHTTYYGSFPNLVEWT